MSLITHITVVASYVSPEMQRLLTEPLDFDERHQSLHRLAMGDAGGSKVFCQDVFAAAFNYLDEYAFDEWIMSLPWGTNHAVVVVSPEMDDGARTFVAGDPSGLGRGPLVDGEASG